MMRRRPRNIERLRAALATPLALHLSPTFLPPHSETGRGRQFAVYVEPPKAPGVQRVLRTLRKKMRSEPPIRPRIFPKYIRLVGDGVRHAGATSSVVEEGIDDWPVIRACYRLILARGLEPVGYCTFSVELGDFDTLMVGVEEVWIERRHRRKGLGTALAAKTAQIVRDTLLELDERFLSSGVNAHDLLVLVVADVCSASGNEFLYRISARLKPTVADTDALALHIKTEPW